MVLNPACLPLLSMSRTSCRGGQGAGEEEDEGQQGRRRRAVAGRQQVGEQGRRRGRQASRAPVALSCWGAGRRRSARARPPPPRRPPTCAAVRGVESEQAGAESSCGRAEEAAVFRAPPLTGSTPPGGSDHSHERTLRFPPAQSTRQGKGGLRGPGRAAGRGAASSSSGARRSARSRGINDGPAAVLAPPVALSRCAGASWQRGEACGPGVSVFALVHRPSLARSRRLTGCSRALLTCLAPLTGPQARARQHTAAKTAARMVATPNTHTRINSGFCDKNFARDAPSNLKCRTHLHPYRCRRIAPLEAACIIDLWCPVCLPFLLLFTGTSNALQRRPYVTET